MSLKHNDIWRAIDRLAEQHGLSPSGLARKAGLSSTVFNISKRASASRKRWPSTESIAEILRATDTKLDDFVALASPNREGARKTLPMIGLDAAQKGAAFDESGFTTGKEWEEINLPAINDPQAFVLEITAPNWEPVYRSGDRLILSSTEKPRTGDRIALRTIRNEIVIGQLARENARLIEIGAFKTGEATMSFAPKDVDWLRRIVWVSQ